MLFTMVAATFLQSAVAVLSPFLADEFDLSAGQLGLLGTILYATAATLSPAVGMLVDTLGGKRMAALLFSVSAMSILAFSVSPSYPWLMVAVVASGFGLSGGNPVTNHLLSGHIAPGQRGLLIGVKQSGVKVGQFLAGSLLPMGALAIGWRSTLRVAALVFFCGVIVVYMFVPRVAQRERGTGQSPIVRGPLGPTVWRLAVFASLMGMGSSAVNFHLPLYAFNNLGLGVRTAGLTVGVVGFIGIIARIAWGPLAERFSSPAVPLVILSTGSIVAQAAVWGSGTIGIALLWVGAVGLGLTAAVWNTVANYAIISAEDGQPGRATGVMMTGFVIGLSIGPGLFGLGVEATGSYTIGWLGVTVAFVLASAVAIQWWRSEQTVKVS